MNYLGVMLPRQLPLTSALLVGSTVYTWMVLWLVTTHIYNTKKRWCSLYVKIHLGFNHSSFFCTVQKLNFQHFDLFILWWFCYMVGQSGKVWNPPRPFLTKLHLLPDFSAIVAHFSTVSKIHHQLDEWMNFLSNLDWKITI